VRKRARRIRATRAAIEMIHAGSSARVFEQTEIPLRRPRNTPCRRTSLRERFRRAPMDDLPASRPLARCENTNVARGLTLRRARDSWKMGDAASRGRVVREIRVQRGVEVPDPPRRDRSAPSGRSRRHREWRARQRSPDKRGDSFAPRANPSAHPGSRSARLPIERRRHDRTAATRGTTRHGRRLPPLCSPLGSSCSPDSLSAGARPRPASPYVIRAALRFAIL
jgi:hypothetical protein